MGSRRRDVVVVGAGLAGLRCAHELHRAGLDVLVLESSDEVGGRVRTDRVDGFLLDRGFQVLNDGYPEARRALDLRALRLQRMDDALVVRRGGRLHRVDNPLGDPLVGPVPRPGDVARLATTSLLPLGQKARLGAYAAQTLALPPSLLLRRSDEPARAAWRRAGISEETIDEVLRPFFSGVVLETRFDTSRRFLDLMFRMFARGHSTLPTRGMQAIPGQLAERLPAEAVQVRTEVGSVAPGGVVTGEGDVDATAVVVATDPWTAHRLVPGLGSPPPARGVTTVYHAAPVWPGQRSTLVADADGSAVANSIVLSAGAPSYAPSGRALVASSVVHEDGRAVPDEHELLRVLGDLHEQDASGWERLAAYDIPQALPAMTAPHPFRRPVRVGPGLYVAGDHRDTSSIQGALVSGRRAAEAVLRDLG